MKRVFGIPDRSHGQGGISFKWQTNQGNYLSTTGSDQNVRIYDRHGEIKEEIPLPGICTGFDWDKDGDLLAIINDKSSVLFLWDSNTHRVTQVDTGLRDTLTFLLWSQIGPQLAIGTAKGNLLIYNHATTRKIPILGKHSRKIVCGAWSQENLLALGSEDKSISISNADGDSLRQTNMRDVPSAIQFSEMKTDERSTMGQNTVSCIIAKKTLFLYNLNDPENPVELAFQQRYGSIVAYKWFGDGYILIGFSQGYFIAISTHLREIGQELFQAHDHKDSLTDIAVSPAIGKCASVGDSCVKIHDMSDIRELTAIINLEDERAVESCSWTDDGQLLAVSTPKGSLHIFLTKLPMLGSTAGTRLAHLTSLLEVTLEDPVLKEPPHTLAIEVEPTFIGLGPDHLAVGMNNRAWFYRLEKPDPVMVYNQEYLGTVSSIALNSEYAAIGLDGKVMLHVLEGESTGATEESRERRLFPDESHQEDKITHFNLTTEFLIFSTASGVIHYFYLEDWQYVNEYRHVTGIKRCFPNANGTRVVFIDDKSDGFVYNPVNDHVVDMPSFSPTTTNVLWDESSEDQGVILTFDEERLTTYVYNRESVNTQAQLGLSAPSNPSGNISGQGYFNGNDQEDLPSHCSFVGVTKLPYGHVPLLLHRGELTLMTQSGKLVTTTLGTHSYSNNLDKLDNLPESELIAGFEQALSLFRLDDAWQFAQKINSRERWTDLGQACLKILKIDEAIRVFRHISDAGMVMALLRIKDTEDRNLLCGYIAMFLGDFNTAQDLFLTSSQPIAALDMRRDLLHWDAALQLAKALAPDQIPFISKEYAQQLEFTGDYVNALLHYERGLTHAEVHKEHDEACHTGIAKMAVRLGDTKRGVSMAIDSQSRFLKKECASILEHMKHWQEAAQLYELAGYYEKAVTVYIRWKNWAKVGELLKHVTSPKLHLQYAKAREAEGRYKDALGAFEAAKDWDSVIRMHLDHLGNPEEAVRIVREIRSIEGAKMVAQFFIRLNDYASAIQFLVMSKCLDEAFQLAQTHGQMETYAEIIGSDATPDDYQSIALHFENERSDKSHFLAGKFFLLAGQYERALKHFLRVPYTEDSQALDLAIETVGRGNDVKLTHMLIDYLMGETDDMPKDCKYLFRLYMALKQYTEAARTAIIIAREEQNVGNYRNAHDLLFSMMQELRQQKIKIPAEMANNLMLLHSYIIAKLHIRRGDHLKGARMLIRVAQNISKFPAHVVPILTSTVVSCHRSGLRNSSFSYAAMLMRPEYRDQIDVKYKKKIETVVRRPDKSEEEEPRSACPYCQNELPETELYCTECKNNIPYCIVTGRHMVKMDFGSCPSCNFPALYSEFLELLDSEENCPMCSDKVLKESLVKPKDINTFLNPELVE